MKPAEFELLTPTSVAEAVELLCAHGDDAKLLAGGQSLVPVLNMRLAAPRYLIDLNRVAELDYVRLEGDRLAVGALTRHRTLETTALVRTHSPLLAEAASQIGHPPVRYRGTIGGSLAHAHPAAALPIALLALDAELRALGPAGARIIAADAFFLGPMTTALGADEILVEVRVAVPGARSGAAFVALGRRHGDFPLAAIACSLSLDAATPGRIARARLVVGAVGGVIVRAIDAEALLTGQGATPELILRAAELAVSAVEPVADVQASAAYRRELGRVLTMDAIERAVERARALPSLPHPGKGQVPHPASPPPPCPTPHQSPAQALRVHQGGENAPRPALRAVRLRVNGVGYEAIVPPRRLLSDCLRDDLGLTGTHVGCEHGICGACTVLVDGQAVRSCLLFAAQMDGAEITTVEGLARGERLHPLQAAFSACHGLQCGFCTPGMLLTALDFLRQCPSPTEDEVRRAMAGSLCRCTGYQSIVDAVLMAAPSIVAWEGEARQETCR